MRNRKRRRWENNLETALKKCTRDTYGCENPCNSINKARKFPNKPQRSPNEAKAPPYCGENGRGLPPRIRETARLAKTAVQSRGKSLNPAYQKSKPS